ncbi:MAG: helix-turn-helix transcriptional regulator [Planctomycetes bacterium]|nr:helix-turn-helix transcriptional regulator [Planctomycetota bacterium]
MLDAVLHATAVGRCPVRTLAPATEPPPPQWRHIHSQPELFIQCGGATRFVFPESPRELELRAGEVLPMPALLAHGETVVGGASFANLVFMPNERQIAYHLARRSRKYPTRPDGAASDIVTTPDARLAVAALEGLVRCARTPEPVRSEVAGWFTSWASLIRGLIADAPTRDSDDDRVARCRSLVETYLSKADLSVELLAHWCGCSADHLGRTFRQDTGETLAGHIVRMRITRARALLAASDLPVRTVADAVGHRDPSYFCRSFRREVGMTPEAWRRRGAR